MIQPKHNCYKPELLRYYLKQHDSEKKFYSCKEACLYCSDVASDSSTNYLSGSCDNENGYYQYELQIKNCKKGLTDHYLDGNIWQPCHQNCLTCKGGFSDVNKNCTTCKNGYYFKDDEPTVFNCYESTPLGYYLKDIEDGQQVWSKCNESCNHCNGLSNETTTNCKIEECTTTPTNNPYYPYEAYQTNCAQNPEGYFKNENGRWKPCYRTWASCELKYRS